MCLDFQTTIYTVIDKIDVQVLVIVLYLIKAWPLYLKLCTTPQAIIQLICST